MGALLHALPQCHCCPHYDDGALNLVFLPPPRTRASTRTPPTQVGVWLGAGVMLEYSYDEARSLLQSNLGAAETKLVRAARGGWGGGGRSSEG